MRDLVSWCLMCLIIGTSVWESLIVAADGSESVGVFDDEASGESGTRGGRNEWALLSDTSVERSFSEDVPQEFYFDKEDTCSRPIPRMGKTTLESSQANHRPIRTVCVTGERHSGTNFLHALLEQNFKYADAVYLPTGADIAKNTTTSTLYRHSRTQRRNNPVGYGCTAHTHGFQPQETLEINRFRAESMLAGQNL